MFIKINDKLFIFNSKNNNNISFTKFKIDDVNYRINNKKFKDFLEYSLLLDVYPENSNLNHVIETLEEYIDLINYEQNISYYAIIVNFLIKMYLEDITDFTIAKEDLKKYIKKINIREDYFLYTYFFLHNFKLTMQNDTVIFDEYYFTLKDIIFDFYS